jgi:hypothetical protein
MFRIVTTKGKELGLTEKVNYIRINKRNGCFNSCDKKDAIGVALENTAYNLFGHEDIQEAETVLVVEVDGGHEVSSTKENAAELATQLAETDEAAIELYEANMILEEANAEQDEAIIEIYEMIGELTNG